jgi:hypothetical protein
MRTAIVLALALSATACSTWPEGVGSGLADPAKPAAGTNVIMAGTERHLDCTLQRLDLLSKAADRNGRATGRVDLLESNAERAQREVASRLTSDADRTLTKLDREVAALGETLHVEPSDLRQCEVPNTA